MALPFLLNTMMHFSGIVESTLYIIKFDLKLKNLGILQKKKYPTVFGTIPIFKGFLGILHFVGYTF